VKVYTTSSREVVTFYLTLREALGNKSGQYWLHRIASKQRDEQTGISSSPGRYPFAMAALNARLSGR